MVFVHYNIESLIRFPTLIVVRNSELQYPSYGENKNQNIFHNVVKLSPSSQGEL